MKQKEENNVRKCILEKIREKVLRDKTAFLHSPVLATADFIGANYPIVVRKVSVVPGYAPEALEFLVGNDECGNPVTTTDLGTDDLLVISERIGLGAEGPRA